MRVLLLGLLWLFSGCAHTFTIEKNAPPQRYTEAQSFLHQRPARLFTKAGKQMRVTDWQIGPDSTVFRIDGASDRIVMLNDRIRTLTTQDSRRGLRDGALVGGFCGGIFGFFIGGIAAAIQGSCDDCEEEHDGGAIILTGIGIGAGIGAVSGALIGAHTGAMRTVVFHPDPHDPRRWEYLPR